MNEKHMNISCLILVLANAMKGTMAMLSKIQEDLLTFSNILSPNYIFTRQDTVASSSIANFPSHFLILGGPKIWHEIRGYLGEPSYASFWNSSLLSDNFSSISFSIHHLNNIAAVILNLFVLVLVLYPVMPQRLYKL